MKLIPSLLCLYGFTFGALPVYADSVPRVNEVQTERSNPEKVVIDFYRQYLNHWESGGDTIKNKYVSQPLINIIRDALVCSYTADEEEAKQICSTRCNENACYYNGLWIENDVDYFTKSQDVYPDWPEFITTKLISRNDTAALESLTLGKKKEEKTNFTITLIKDNDAWQIWQVQR